MRVMRSDGGYDAEGLHSNSPLSAFTLIGTPCTCVQRPFPRFPQIPVPHAYKSALTRPVAVSVASTVK